MRKELIILSGFLGSGKTTLLRSLLLRHSDRKIAVLLNDLIPPFLVIQPSGCIG